MIGALAARNNLRVKNARQPASVLAKNWQSRILGIEQSRIE